MWTTSATLVFISVLFLFFPAYVTWRLRPECADRGALVGAEQWGDEASGPWEPHPVVSAPSAGTGSRPVAEQLADGLALFSASGTLPSDSWKLLQGPKDCPQYFLCPGLQELGIYGRIYFHEYFSGKLVESESGHLPAGLLCWKSLYLKTTSLGAVINLLCQRENASSACLTCH